MATLAPPEIIITCSLAECQCQGMTHPVAALASMTEGLLEGSPFCTEPVMHFGSPGKFTNLLDAFAAYTILSSACKGPETRAMINNITSEPQTARRIAILLIEISHGSIAERLPSLSCRETGIFVSHQSIAAYQTPTGCFAATGTEVNHLNRSGLSPRTMPKNSRCNALVTGPTLPLPTRIRSTDRIGVTSAAVP